MPGIILRSLHIAAHFLFPTILCSIFLPSFYGVEMGAEKSHSGWLQSLHISLTTIQTAPARSKLPIPDSSLGGGASPNPDGLICSLFTFYKRHQAKSKKIHSCRKNKHSKSKRAFLASAWLSQVAAGSPGRNPNT